MLAIGRRAVRAGGRIRRAIPLGLRRRGPVPQGAPGRCRRCGTQPGVESIHAESATLASRRRSGGPRRELRALSAEVEPPARARRAGSHDAITPREGAAHRHLRHWSGRPKGLHRALTRGGIEVVGFTASAATAAHFRGTTRAAAGGHPALAIRSPDRRDPALFRAPRSVARVRSGRGSALSGDRRRPVPMAGDR